MKSFNQQKLSKNTNRNQKMKKLQKQQLSGCDCFVSEHKRETTPKILRS